MKVKRSITIKGVWRRSMHCRGLLTESIASVRGVEGGSIEGELKTQN